MSYWRKNLSHIIQTVTLLGEIKIKENLDCNKKRCTVLRSFSCSTLIDEGKGTDEDDQDDEEDDIRVEDEEAEDADVPDSAAGDDEQPAR